MRIVMRQENTNTAKASFLKGGRRGRYEASSLYRTARDVRCGFFPVSTSFDGVCPRYQKPVFRETFSTKRRGDILKWKNSFDSQRWVIFMGRRGIFFALFLGMVFMGTMTYILGQGVRAQDISPVVFSLQQRVLGMETERKESAQEEEKIFEGEIRDMVKGYPIEDMVPYIAKQDKRVAAYLIAIAKKESNWGRRIPVYYGENCFNYWGYRGQDEIMGSAGHTCFDTPIKAVSVVANRLHTLIIDQGLTTARDLIIWKCGSSCSGHSRDDVEKWIDDVGGYYYEVMASE